MTSLCLLAELQESNRTQKSQGSRKERALRPLPRGGGRTARHEVDRELGHSALTAGPGLVSAAPAGTGAVTKATTARWGFAPGQPGAMKPLVLLHGLPELDASAYAKPVQPGLDRRVKFRLIPAASLQPASLSLCLPGKQGETPSSETRSCLARTKAAWDPL